jgi:hypothetical protein
MFYPFLQLRIVVYGFKDPNKTIVQDDEIVQFGECHAGKYTFAVRTIVVTQLVCFSIS